VSGYHSRGGFFERNIKSLHAAMDHALYAETSISAVGLLQAIDPRVKVAGLLALIVAAALASRLWTLAALLVAGAILAALSRISPRLLATRVWATAFVFSAAISIPALFLTPCPELWRSPNGVLAITTTGLRTASFLILRVESSATLALLMIFTTPWMHVLPPCAKFSSAASNIMAMQLSWLFGPQPGWLRIANAFAKVFTV